MKFRKVESSQISEVGYEPETETLGIRFKAKGDWPASEYHYANVNETIHKALLDAESVGKAFQFYIKANPKLYPHIKIRPSDYLDAELTGRDVDDLRSHIAAEDREFSGIDRIDER